MVYKQKHYSANQRSFSTGGNQSASSSLANQGLGLGASCLISCTVTNLLWVMVMATMFVPHDRPLKCEQWLPQMLQMIALVLGVAWLIGPYSANVGYFSGTFRVISGGSFRLRVWVMVMGHW